MIAVWIKAINPAARVERFTVSATCSVALSLAFDDGEILRIISRKDVKKPNVLGGDSDGHPGARFAMGVHRMKCKMLSAAIAALTLAGCAANAPGPVDNRNSALTQGNVQMNLKVGETTKAQVLETFGSPNITTRDASGAETWSYQRHATVAQASGSSNYWTILLVGGGSSAAGFSQTSRTMTLIIKFDDRDVVSDFRSRTSDF